MTFDKRQSNIAKGVSALLLLWCHVFANNDRIKESIAPFLSIGGTPFVCLIAPICKVCVAIFCVLSGYGMFKSFSSYANKHLSNGKLKFTKQASFAKNHLLNMMSRYWFVYIVFGLLGIALGVSRFSVYEGSIVCGIIDFFGLAHLFSTPTLNATWWFMFAIIILYLIYPLIHKLFSYSPEFTLALSFALLMSPTFFAKYHYIILNFQVCQFAFITGMYFSKHNLFERASEKLNTPLKSIFFSVLSVLTTAFTALQLDVQTRYKFDTVFALSLIVASSTLLSKIPVLSKILEEFGKYSAIIFMSHTFIYLYYFRDFIYWFKYPIVIFIVLAVASYIAARLIDLLMKLTRYNKLFEILTSKKKKA